MSEKSKKIVALILAAGESSRLGQAKQNLPLRNTTLLNNIKEHLTLNIVEQTFIVLGAYAKEIQEKSGLNDYEVIVFNEWKEGMGSSLSYACAEIFHKKKYDGILVTLSDVPLVTASDYREMINLFESESDIVATLANNSLGVPAIFGAAYFSELLKIKGNKGAKRIIENNRTTVKVFRNKNAAVDIDTLDDYLKLINES